MGTYLMTMLMQQRSASPGEEAIKEAIARAIEQGGPFGPSGPFAWPGVLNSIFVTLGFFALVALIAWLLFRRGQTRVQARAEFHHQLLEKFTSSGEFAAFLNSSGGQRLLEDLWSQHVNAKEHIVANMRRGVVLAVLGLGMLALSTHNHNLLIVGALILALGVGFLLSVAVSYRLSKKLGLLKDSEASTGGER